MGAERGLFGTVDRVELTPPARARVIERLAKPWSDSMALIDSAIICADKKVAAKKRG